MSLNYKKKHSKKKGRAAGGRTDAHRKTQADGREDETQDGPALETQQLAYRRVKRRLATTVSRRSCVGGASRSESSGLSGGERVSQRRRKRAAERERDSLARERRGTRSSPRGLIGEGRGHRAPYAAGHRAEEGLRLSAECSKGAHTEGHNTHAKAGRRTTRGTKVVARAGALEEAVAGEARRGGVGLRNGSGAGRIKHLDVNQGVREPAIEANQDDVWLLKQG